MLILVAMHNFVIYVIAKETGNTRLHARARRHLPAIKKIDYLRRVGLKVNYVSIGS